MSPSKQRSYRRKPSQPTAEHGFRQVAWWVRMPHGWAQAQLGHPDEGASLIRDTLTPYRTIGSLFLVPVFLTWLAEAQALGGALAESLRTLDEALTLNPDERFWRPETLRVRGDIRCKQGDEELAEADFRDAIALAREMSAKAWELRAATSLARLWCQQGRRAEARDLLASVYSWFTEGFDTTDLKDAKALLDELKPPAPPVPAPALYGRLPPVAASAELDTPVIPSAQAPAR